MPTLDLAELGAMRTDWTLDEARAHAMALAAQQGVVQLRLARLHNAVQLYRALGGGAPPP